MRPFWLVQQSRGISTSCCLRGATWIPETPLQEMPKDFKENPERDIVNFPHPVRQMFPPKTRLGFIPDSWFNAFYDITGVTGPYLLTGGLVLFIVQKEMLGPSHEMVILGTRIALIVFLARKFGHYDCKVKIDAYKAIVPMIYDAKRENLALQLEADYRHRLAFAHAEVKKRLDYMADVVAVKRKYQARNMVDWIVKEVVKAITPELEKATLQQCIQRLQELSGRPGLNV
ncbi:Mt ATP-synt B domain containing protein [Trichuris trichiura]|uniref:ATP synthase subunit b n=1 Tax=Trichuris trichiura TaxID=36087 RepID=A0A077ZDQ1_TRITR|nr:Mt ATP-synt B domain containing protein [Trichuris trichiura]